MESNFRHFTLGHVCWLFLVISIFLTTVYVLTWCANERPFFFPSWSNVKQATAVKGLYSFCVAARSMFSLHACSKYNACYLELLSKRTCSLLLHSWNISINIAYLHIIPVVMIINVDTVFFVTRHFTADGNCKQTAIVRRYHPPARALPCTLHNLFLCMM